MIGWCIPHRVVADNAKGGSGQTPPPHGIGLKALSDISYEGPIRYLHQTLHIGVKITNTTNNVQHLSMPFLLNFGTNCQARLF